MLQLKFAAISSYHTGIIAAALCPTRNCKTTRSAALQHTKFIELGLQAKENKMNHSFQYLSIRTEKQLAKNRASSIVYIFCLSFLIWLLIVSALL